MMSLMEAALATGGTALYGNPRFEGVSTDTRTIASGELFIALKGENFDGHEFVDAAAERGAAAAMVEQDWAAGRSSGLPLLTVADTRLALGYLGAWWRARFDIPLIGVTGSNGKTTVKEMIAAILRAQALSDGYDPELAVLATTGNLNNDIGLPLMLLRLHGSHRAAVIEMGMNHPGEIAYLTRLAQPTVALVNNAQRAHLAGLGGVAEVARAKGEIFDGLRSGGMAVINADDPFAGLWREMNAGRRMLTFGLGQPADVRGRAEPKALGSLLSIDTPQGAIEVALRLPGLHNARNALAATAAALAAGATPDAVSAGLTSFGGQAGQFHDEIGGYAKSQGVDQLFALGEHSELASRNFGAGGQHFGSVEALLEALAPQLGGDTVVLVKGSRFMRMERVADAVADDGKSGNGAH